MVVPWQTRVWMKKALRAVTRNAPVVGFQMTCFKRLRLGIFSRINFLQFVCASLKKNDKRIQFYSFMHTFEVPFRCQYLFTPPFSFGLCRGNQILKPHGEPNFFQNYISHCITRCSLIVYLHTAFVCRSCVLFSCVVTDRI